MNQNVGGVHVAVAQGGGVTLVHQWGKTLQDYPYDASDDRPSLAPRRQPIIDRNTPSSR